MYHEAQIKPVLVTRVKYSKDNQEYTHLAQQHKRSSKDARSTDDLNTAKLTIRTKVYKSNLKLQKSLIFNEPILHKETK